MTTEDDASAPPPLIRQEVHAESGYAYGVIGADIHVFGDGLPVYMLENWRAAPATDAEWLREPPSRMLNARFAVVPFTGRVGELAQLHDWRRNGPRLGARWLHGPGGQGKTRLAAQFAAETLADGWKIVTAIHGPGTALPSARQEDLRLGDATGLLVVVDYADRWPLTHLTWLFSNALLHQVGVPTRILLLARTADAWPAIRGALANHQADTSGQLLAPLPDGSGHRVDMFTAARDSFAVRYDVRDPTGIAPPGRLDHPDLGLTLAVHMAALVAVDAHVTGRRPPADMAGLTVYLLDREHLHWARLYGDGTHELDPSERTYLTSPTTMNQTVFAAALTGSVETSAGTALLDGLGLELPSEQIVADHSVCYPPADPARATVLEPLYPDRLAEDFLALTFPGHPADYPAQPWAAPTATVLLDRRGDERATNAYAVRALTLLAAAAERWPHLGPGYLYPLLRRDPRLAIDAGSAALASLAGIEDVDLDVLEAIETLVPADRHVDLDVGIAALVQRLTSHRLAAATDDVERAVLHQNLGFRLEAAGRDAEALAATEQAVDLWERLAVADPRTFDPLLAQAYGNLSGRLSDLGRRGDALQADRRAVAIWQRLARSGPAFQPGYADALKDLGLSLAAHGRRAEARAATERAIGIYQRLGANDRAEHAPEIAAAWDSLGNQLAQLGRWKEALVATENAVEIRQRLARVNPAGFEPTLAASLGHLAMRLAELGRREDALAVAQQVVAVWQRLAEVNPAAFEPSLARGLDNLGLDLIRMGRWDEALVATGQAVELYRRLATNNPAAYASKLAGAHDHLGHELAEQGRAEEALAAARQAVEVYERLAGRDPAAFELDLAKSLDNLGLRLAVVERHRDALAASARAVEIFRRLATGDPTAFEPDLARGLHNLGTRFADLERWAEALDAIVRSVGLRRRLAHDNPAAFEADLARSLVAFALICLDARAESKLDGAGRAAEEAVVLYRRLSERVPAAFDRHLVQAVTLRRAFREVLTPTPAAAPEHRFTRWFRRK